MRAASAERLPRNSEALQLLRGYIRVLETGRPATSPQARDMIRRHLIDLAALAVESRARLGESTLSAVAAARVNAARALIEARFDQPDLTVASVAQSLCISPRYLQRLFEMTGTSFTPRVNDLRLERVFALLTEARGNAGRISHIALQAGFSDVSHFNRNFKRRYGASPSEIRVRHD